MKRYFYVLFMLMVSCSSAQKDEGRSEGNSIKDMIGADRIYTLVNLHYDTNNKVSAVNYQSPGLISLGSEVELISCSSKRLVFKVKSSGFEYYYDYHRKAAAEPFDTHLRRYFGREKNSEKVDLLSEIDQEGIKRGQAKVGMSKQGVIYAMGYPPPHVTPDTQHFRWTYWKHRFDKMIVEFDDQDKVKDIID